jgi:hypothetical protein
MLRPTDTGAETVWRRADDVLTRRTSRSVLVTTVGPAGAEPSEPLVLEGAAIAVWEALHAPATDEQLVAAVAFRFGVAAGAIRAEVAATREVLRRHGVLVGSDD